MNRTRILAACLVAAVLGLSQAAAQDNVAVNTGASGKRITLHTDKSDIGTVLTLVAEHGGLSLVVGTGVEGQVTVALDDVPVEVALRAIAVNNGFTYTVESGVITVSAPSAQEGAPKPPPTVTRSFVLRSIDAQAIKNVLQHILTPGVGHMEVLHEDSRPIHYMQNINDLSGDFKNSANNRSTTASQQNQSTGGLIQGSNEAEANSRTLIVTDIEEVVDRVASVIADLDRPPPQVLIEARLIEMSTVLQRELGIDWNIEIFANGPILNHQWPLRNRAGFSSGTQIRRNPTGFPQNVAGLALGTIDFSRLNAVLRANQDDNAVRLLANPRMLIRNNHPASILVGERYPIFEANITDFGTVTEAFDTYVPIGIQLDVKPTIMPDGRISNYVHAVISSLGDDVVGTTGLRVARINTREISTRVIMRDGQTIVLGGLITDRKVHAVSKVPGLGDIPILSAFFRQENPRSERVDLLVFLTARVDGAVELSKRDRKVFDKYRPHFKHVERLQDVPLHFEIPTEYEPPRPMFSDPPIEHLDDDEMLDEDTPYHELPDEDSRFGAMAPPTLRPDSSPEPPTVETGPDVRIEPPAAPSNGPAVSAERLTDPNPDSHSHGDAAVVSDDSIGVDQDHPKGESDDDIQPAPATATVGNRATDFVPRVDRAIDRWLETLVALERQSGIDGAGAPPRAIERTPRPPSAAYVVPMGRSVHTDPGVGRDPDGSGDGGLLADDRAVGQPVAAGAGTGARANARARISKVP